MTELYKELWRLESYAETTERASALLYAAQERDLIEQIYAALRTPGSEFLVQRRREVVLGERARPSERALKGGKDSKSKVGKKSTYDSARYLNVEPVGMKWEVCSFLGPGFTYQCDVA